MASLPIQHTKILHGTKSQRWIINLPQSQSCEYFRCQEDAQVLAFDDVNSNVGYFCKKHAEDIINESGAFVSIDCPNCTCKIGVFYG